MTGNRRYVAYDEKDGSWSVWLYTARPLGGEVELGQPIRRMASCERCDDAALIEAALNHHWQVPAP
jgi:hypothetical protein